MQKVCQMVAKKNSTVLKRIEAFIKGGFVSPSLGCNESRYDDIYVRFFKPMYIKKYRILSQKGKAAVLGVG